MRKVTINGARFFMILMINYDFISVNLNDHNNPRSFNLPLLQS